MQKSSAEEHRVSVTILPNMKRQELERLTIKRNTARAVKHSFFHLERLPWSKWNLGRRMGQLVCVNTSSGSSSTSMVTDCLRKLIEWIHIPRLRVWKKTQVEQFPPIMQQIFWENYWSRTSSLDKATGCLRKLICLSYIIWSDLSIKRTPAKKQLYNFAQNT